jgi:hypothetical protein
MRSPIVGLSTTGVSLGCSGCEELSKMRGNLDKSIFTMGFSRVLRPFHAIPELYTLERRWEEHRKIRSLRR